MEPSITVSEIEFKDGTTVELKKNEIIALVGPNNAGKSATLREITDSIKQNNVTNIITQSVKINKEATSEELFKFISENYKNDINLLDHFRIGDRSINKQGIEIRWNESSNCLYELANIFLLHLSTESRLHLSNSPGSFNLLKENPIHPIQYLYKYDSLEKKFSEYFKQAFGQDLIVNRGAGSLIPLHVGNRPMPKDGEDRLSVDYLTELNKLPTIEDQGDGMRGFVGVLLSVFVTFSKIVLIDEPEAFLHPPQAYLLGKMLSKDLPSNKQIFLATHSEDLLKGLIDGNADRIKIIRIQRSGSKNEVKELNSEDIKTLWKNPLLKYSNILDGIFHSRVIVCESDGDCKFYSAVLDSIINSDEAIPDFLFVHCGGKDRIPDVINPLKKLGVRVNAIADFDLLSNKEKTKIIFESLGGNWESVAKDYSIFKNKIDEKKPERNTIDIKSEINDILNSITTKVLPENKVTEIQTILKKYSPWAQAKEMGKNFIPTGDPRKAFDRMNEAFQGKGLHIVEVGELECFCRDIPSGSKPKWLNEVLTRDLANDTELEEARRFVKRLINIDKTTI
ncbi:hypothetical protein GCM10027347_17360 [Larkinella harenae]